MPFPFIDITVRDVPEEVWQPFKEFEWDIETGDYVIRNGQIGIVEGLPALRIWIYKALKTARGRYDAYTWNFGHDYETLIGAALTHDVITSEAKRMTKDALFVNKHIKDIRDFKAWIEDNTLKIEFIAVTDSGDLEVKF